MPVIDFHLHIIPLERLLPSVATAITSASSFDRERYMRATQDPRELLAIMNDAGVERTQLIAYPATTVMGYGPDYVEWVIQYAEADPDRLFVAVSVDPLREAEPRRVLEQYFTHDVVRSIKVHPVHQLFRPNAYRREEGSLHQLEVIYEFAIDQGVPVTIHTGTSIFPGSRLKYGDPLFLDDVATDFPRMQLVMAHGGRPLWHDTAFFLLRKHRNLYLDISGIPPRRLLDDFPRLAEVGERVVFGSDWPSPGVKSVRQNVEETRSLPVSEAIKNSILHECARRLLHC